MNQSLAYVRVGEHSVVKFEIKLHNNYDGTVGTHWVVKYSGLDSKGNEIIENLLQELPLDPIMESLQYYLDHGRQRGSVL